MEQNNQLTQIYNHAAEVIKTAILQGQYEAAKGVNRSQLATYFGVGKYVSANTRNGVWGIGALKAISKRLQRLLPGLRGYSESQLKFMRLFYEGWAMLDANSLVATNEIHDIPNLPVTIDELPDTSKSLVATNEIDAIDIYRGMQIPDMATFPVEDFFRVPFTHHCRILERAKELDERYYYIHRCAEEHMSVDQIKKVLANDDYHHKDSIPNNFAKTLSKSKLARKAVLAFKDEYLLNFINIEEIGERDAADVDERVVEQSIVHNIKKFIMTFGRDFAYVGNQLLMEVYGVEQFPDLVFFNRELNCLVIVELKTGDFKTSYLGQLMGYLSIADAKLKKAHENPSIGIVLCKTANKRFVEFVIKDYDKPMGVATYKTSEEMPERLRNVLPAPEELEKLL